LSAHRLENIDLSSPDHNDRYEKGHLKTIETEPDYQLTMGAGMIEISPAARNELDGVS